MTWDKGTPDVNLPGLEATVKFDVRFKTWAIEAVVTGYLD